MDRFETVLIAAVIGVVAFIAYIFHVNPIWAQNDCVKTRMYMACVQDPHCSMTPSSYSDFYRSALQCKDPTPNAP